MGDIQDSHTLRVALSYRPQASIVGITNRALRMLWNEGYTPLLQIHDNSGLEVEYREYDKGWEDLEKALTHPITLHGRTFTVPLDTEWGFNWAPYHEIENPGGLRGGRVMASELPRIYAETRSA